MGLCNLPFLRKTVFQVRTLLLSYPSYLRFSLFIDPDFWPLTLSFSDCSSNMPILLRRQSFNLLSLQVVPFKYARLARTSSDAALNQRAQAIDVLQVLQSLRHSMLRFMGHFRIKKAQKAVFGMLGKSFDLLTVDTAT